MYVLLIALFITGIQAQNKCSCLCCLGQYCQPLMVGTVNVQNCSTETCLSQCRCSYPQCAANYPYGQILAQCSSPAYTLFNCECKCCNTGLFTCIPTFVGYSTSYLCDISSCSIACSIQYPMQCVSSQNGQTQGLCTGPVTTTTTSTPMPPWLGNICSCSHCQPGFTCSPNLLVGITSASQCSSPACTQACQNRYVSTCSPTYLNQISGVCLSETNGRTKCKCNCCGGYGCIDYELNTNETCTTCYAKCLQVSPCTSTLPVTYTCTLNKSIILTNYSFSIIILTLIIAVILLN
ncbi:unnamed protein product [Rotaria sp. Silwood2]|nr:unnamed protein product [Rotaria sp. Silwood2]CAF2978307.1 unnamed protein product [Rotaria sp. Silwood2]CAF3283621.1 unnamed protein product [Rotaria sp. Silwood2]CAF4060087.1 unnamed protein product [Rotaria sp. Silwood2]CAF4078885.1 unnamed protein product [Rotaria sp. Silwood2]